LRAFNVEAVPYIPHRINEGHGLKIAALEALHKQGVSLVITCDCGVTGVAPVKKLTVWAWTLLSPTTIPHRRIHLPPLPSLIPKVPASHYPFVELAGVGVAYKLLQALLMGVNKEAQLGEVADLVALGTVADMTPLLGENRYLVSEGLKRMNASLGSGLWNY